MDIKKADGKGRVSIGGEGYYNVRRGEDGSISLSPVSFDAVDVPPQMDRGLQRAVYVNFSPYSSTPPTVTIFSQLPNDVEFIANIAEKCRVPIVVSGSGIGSAWAERIERVTTQPVVVVMT